MREMIASSLHRSWNYFYSHLSYHQARAAALTYYTLFAIVPLIVLILFIANGFFLEKEIALFLLNKFQLEEKIFTLLLLFAMRAIEGARGLFFIGFAVTFYLWSSFALIDRLERHLNQLLGFTEGRSILQKLLTYPLMLLFLPLAALFLNMVGFYLAARLSELAPTVKFLSEYDPFLINLLNLLPSLMTALLIGIAYYSIPNGKVQWRSALYAGLIAAILYQLFQWGFFYFQLRTIHYNLIWGTFAIFPLFLLWLNISWLIFLLGGEILALFHKPPSHEPTTPPTLPKT